MSTNEQLVEVLKQLIAKLTLLISLLSAQGGAYVPQTVTMPPISLASTSQEIYDSNRVKFLEVTQYQRDACWKDLVDEFGGNVNPPLTAQYQDCVTPTNTRHKTPQQLELYKDIKAFEEN